MSELEESGGEEDVALAHFLPFPLSYPKLGSSSNYSHLTSLVCPSHSTNDHPPTSPAMGKVARWFRSFLGMEQTKDQRCQRQNQLPLPPPARCPPSAGASASPPRTRQRPPPPRHPSRPATRWSCGSGPRSKLPYHLLRSKQTPQIRCSLLQLRDLLRRWLRRCLIWCQWEIDRER